MLCVGAKFAVHAISQKRTHSKKRSRTCSISINQTQFFIEKQDVLLCFNLKKIAQRTIRFRKIEETLPNTSSGGYHDNLHG